MGYNGIVGRLYEYGILQLCFVAEGVFNAGAFFRIT
jgi:hypothetical protein